ncbi:hypothetical protein N9N67_03550 [Bacteriovoracaceae bacterium]|nr:hypothetical protein [Bacteriovoracaceae bacterium]
MKLKKHIQTLLPLLLIGLNFGCGKGHFLNSKNEDKAEEKKKVKSNNLVILDWIEKDLNAKEVYLTQDELDSFLQFSEQENLESFELQTIKNNLKQYIQEAKLLHKNFPRKKYRWKEREEILSKIKIAEKYLENIEIMLQENEENQLNTKNKSETQVCDQGSALDFETIEKYKKRFSEMKRKVFLTHKIDLGVIDSGSRKNRYSDKNIKKLSLIELKKTLDVLERFYYEALSFLRPKYQDQFPRETRILSTISRTIEIIRELIENKEKNRNR